MSKEYYVYILGNERPTLYIGVTSNLIKRIYEHREGFVDGFTRKYSLKKLLYFESHTSAEEAVLRERQLKKWDRKWKLELIKTSNPNMKDLYDQVSS